MSSSSSARACSASWRLQSCSSFSRAAFASCRVSTAVLEKDVAGSLESILGDKSGRGERASCSGTGAASWGGDDGSRTAPVFSVLVTACTSCKPGITSARQLAGATGPCPSPGPLSCPHDFPRDDAGLASDAARRVEALAGGPSVLVVARNVSAASIRSRSSLRTVLNCAVSGITRGLAVKAARNEFIDAVLSIVTPAVKEKTEFVEFVA